MKHWLDPVRRALDRVDIDAPRPVFFRDDDAGWDDDALARLLELFDRHRVGIDLAVIPAAVGDGLRRRLGPGLAAGAVRVHQHGWNHDNHEPEGRRCEFGPARSRSEQRWSLRVGAERLTAAFGPAVDPVFTPPWNRCTAVTGQLLAELGWQVLSRDHTAVPLDQAGLAEVPVTFDWFGRSGGKPWDRAERGRRLAAALAGSAAATGVMLHHAVMGADDLAAIDEMVGLLASHPAVAPTSILGAAGVVGGAGRLPGVPW